MVNGAPCNKQHSWLLHGTTSKFSNYVHINRSHTIIAPTTEKVQKQHDIKEERVKMSHQVSKQAKATSQAFKSAEVITAKEVQKQAKQPDIKEDQVKMSHQVPKQAEVITAEEVLSSREEALRRNPFASLFPSLKEAAAHITSEKNWCKEVKEEHVSDTKAEAETEDKTEKHTVKDDAVLSEIKFEEEKKYKVVNSCEEAEEQVSRGEKQLSLLEVGRLLDLDQVMDLVAIKAPRAGVGG